MQSDQKVPKILIEPIQQEEKEIRRSRRHVSLYVKPQVARPVSEQGQKKGVSFEKLPSTNEIFTFETIRQLKKNFSVIDDEITRKDVKEIVPRHSDFSCKIIDKTYRNLNEGPLTPVKRNLLGLPAESSPNYLQAHRLREETNQREHSAMRDRIFQEHEKSS